MTTDEPRGFPESPNAERALTTGAIIAVVAGAVSLANWIGAGASPATFASAATVPAGAFAAGVALRGLGGALTRFTRRAGISALGDVGAFLIFVAIVVIVGTPGDSSGSVALGALIVLAFGLPVVAVLSFISTAIARHRRTRLSAYVAASLFAVVALSGYGATG